MRIAVQGCCHGELDTLYASLSLLQEKHGPIDLLIICGDFQVDLTSNLQSIRDESDMKNLACPDKYRKLGEFHQYYAGLKRAPIPTIFIGGNHEASNYLWELYHGGWVAENIYFLGFAGVVNFGGLRIGGLSGIYKSHHYDMGFFETQPFNEQTTRSIYHLRKYNVYRMAQIKKPLDMMLSHDWPRGIAYHGDLQALCKMKSFLVNEIKSNVLGSPPAELLLKRLRPDYWFSAHLHVKFAALYLHTDKESIKPAENPDEIHIDDDDEDEPTASAEPAQSQVFEVSKIEKKHAQFTKFLALDKILPNRHFLQVIDLPEVDGPRQIQYDTEWLAIVKSTHEYFSLQKAQKILPRDSDIQSRIEQNLKWVEENIACDPFRLIVPPFSMTAPAHDPRKPQAALGTTYINPQTSHFCDLLQIPNTINQGGVVIDYGQRPVPLESAAHHAYSDSHTTGGAADATYGTVNEDYIVHMGEASASTLEIENAMDEADADEDDGFT